MQTVTGQPETPTQYVQRILSTLSDANPIEVLRETPGRLKKLLEGSPEPQLRQASAATGWSVADIAAHLLDTEMVVAYRLRLIQSADGVSIQPFDQDAWVRLDRRLSIPISELLETYRALRSHTVRFLEGLTPEEMDHFGMHAERGKETIAHIIRLHAGHDLNHLRHIAELLTATAIKTPAGSAGPS